jgi:TrmH family RNA methyltransferase
VPVNVSARNARFQVWQALLTNRATRQRERAFIVGGVRPITLAVERGWPLHGLLYASGTRLSRWAAQTLDQARTTTIAVAPELLAELAEKPDGEPELIAVARLGEDDLDRLPLGPDLFTVVCDRASSPGNIGTIIRSADALGATGVVVTGHAADPYAPQAVRASTGSLFALPVLRTSARDVLDWVDRTRAAGLPTQIVGTDETGAHDLSEVDLSGPTLLVVGNETSGLSAAWRAACQTMARIPMSGTASSLNAAAAATVVCYERARQRAAAARERVGPVA